jgi:hypothetical protein
MATTEIRRAETNLLLTELSLKADVADTVIVRECAGRRFFDAGAVIATKSGRTVHRIDFLLTELSLKIRVANADETSRTRLLVVARSMSPALGRGRAVVDFLLTEASFVSFSALAYKSPLDLIIDTHTVVLARIRRAMIDRERRVVT